MKVDVKDVNTTIKKLNIEIPVEVVKAETESCFQRLARSVKLDGFRKGKIPRALLENKYGDSIKNEVLQKLMPEALATVIKEQNIRAITRPLIEEIKMENNKPLFFSAEIDVLPELDLKDFSSLELNREIVNVHEKDIDNVIEYLRESYAVMESANAKVIEAGDYILFDIKGYIDGKLTDGISGKNKSMLVGKKTFFDEIENSVIGMKRGEEKKINFKFPENFYVQEFSEKEAEFVIKIVEIKECNLPEVNEVFLTQVGKGESIDELKKNIRKELESNNRLDGQKRARNLLLNMLIDMNQVDVPPTLKKTETERLLKETEHKMFGSKVKEKGSELSDELKEKISIAAERSLKGEQIIEHYTEKKSIAITEEELDLEIKTIAEEIGQNPQVLKRNFSKDNTIANIRQRLLNEKTLDAMLKSAKVVDIFVDSISNPALFM
jgi:trigger factor